jgi:hypothetical protein
MSINKYFVHTHLGSITVTAGIVMLVSLITAILGYSVLVVAIVSDLLFAFSTGVFVYGLVTLASRLRR